jgi:hypothetical protein
MLNKLRYKLWFIFDLPPYIRQRNCRTGAELGVKAGRSIYRVLRRNPDLKMIGLDLWETQEGSTYSKNQLNEVKCSKRLHPFSDRVALHKGSALDIADKVQDQSLDFIFYDLYNYRISTYELHAAIIRKWLPKLKDNGVFIGRDFHNPDIRKVIEDMGYQLQECRIGKRTSIRLKYF